MGAALFMSSLSFLLGITVILGQRLALPLFIALYLVVWGKYSWLFALLYAVVCGLFLHVLFDQVVHIVWYPSLLFA